MNDINDELKNIDAALLDTPLTEQKLSVSAVAHPPRILMLYGSLRERSYSRLATEEAARLLTAMGAEVKILIRPACHFLTTPRRRTRKLPSCARKAWSGARRSATAR